jgi:glutamyl-tRNA synthetase
MMFRRRGRFAPSPTGELHLGNARTALLAWLQIRAAGGEFILRVEDLDAGRVRGEYRTSHLEDLRWLGLDWDEGPDVGGVYAPYVQSERSPLYVEALRVLDADGLLYPCWCTRKEIAASASAPHGPDDEGPAYPGSCRDRGAPGSGEPALRFRVPPGPVRFHDAVQGDRGFDPSEEIGDFVVKRKDGVAAYQLAVVVDDAAMGVTDVLRGADLLSSTSRQLLLYRALGLEPPRWAHVPLLLDASGERLSKRNRSATLGGLRREGVSPGKVVGWLAWSCGLVPRPVEVRASELVGDFDLVRIPPNDTPVPLPDWA